MRARNHSRLAPLTFFLDRSLGKHTVAERLRQAGAAVQVHDDHFPQDATDIEWLREIGQRGWIVLTKDTSIRYRSHEQTAMMQAGVRAFVLVAGNLSGPEMAAAFVAGLTCYAPFCYQVPAAIYCPGD